MKLNELSSIFPGLLTWKKNLLGEYQEVNAMTAEAFGYTDPQHMIGIKDENTPCKMSECYEIFQREDQKVIETGEIRKFIEVMCCAKNEWKIFLVTKNPFIESGKTIGTFGFCSDITAIFSISLLSIFTHQKQSPISSQKSYTLDGKYDDLKLSKMQSICLFYLLRGKGYKQIANILNISVRSVETHIDYLKLKMNCRSKNDIIEKASTLGYDLYIPDFLFQHQLSLRLPN